MKKRFPFILSIVLITSYIVGVIAFVLYSPEKTAESSVQPVSAELNEDENLIEAFVYTQDYLLFEGVVESIKSNENMTSEVTVNNEGVKKTFQFDSYSNIYTSEGEDTEITLNSRIAVYVTDKGVQKGEPIYARFALLLPTEKDSHHFKIGRLTDNFADEVNHLQVAPTDKTVIVNLSGSVLTKDIIKHVPVVYFYETSENGIVSPSKIIMLEHDIELDEDFTIIDSNLLLKPIESVESIEYDEKD